MGRLTGDAHRASLDLLDRMWPQLDLVEVDEIVVGRAAALARRFGPRGYDAVHCASAEQLDDDGVVVAAGDKRLLDAWVELGMAVFHTNGSTAS